MAKQGKGAMDAVKAVGKHISTFGGATDGYNPAKGRYKEAPKSPDQPKKKGAIDAIKDIGKYISTFGGATEKYNPAPNSGAKKSFVSKSDQSNPSKETSSFSYKLKQK